jgi:putative hydrolase of the HAD superfamily
MTSSSPLIQAVLFDYGLVLTGPPDPAARQRMEQLLHADSSSFHDAYWKYRDDYDRGILTGPRYWGQVAQYLQNQDLRQPLDAATLAALIDADIALWTVPNPPMIDWAASLHRAGVRTGILSNIGDAMEAGIRARFDWIAAFDHHTFSHRLGIAKPDAAIYRDAAEGLGVAPGHILFVDDRQKNIDAARAAGMAAILYSSHQSFLDELRTAPTDGLPLPLG